MSALTIYEEKDSGSVLLATKKHTEIASQLSAIGVRFERWATGSPITGEMDEEKILQTYNDSIEKLKKLEGFQKVDAIRMEPHSPQKISIRRKFLNEHTHSEDEIRFFVEGSGLFYLHVKAKVYSVLCEQGDLISVPANTRHWFDMGTQPSFTALRFFTNPKGWVANFTGDPIAGSFPPMPFNPKAVLCDIEGTTGSISFVKDCLFPYAERNLQAYLETHQDEEPIKRIIQEIEQEIGEPKRKLAEIVKILTDWIHQDLKITPLKELQGYIWEEGYKKGELKGHIFEDALNNLKKWKRAGIALYIYSSGSVKAQKLLFEFTEFGDLRSFFKGYFDTNIGPKKNASSYQKISEAIDLPPKEILFLSDSLPELDAAQDAGMSTGWIDRQNNSELISNHDRFALFSQIPFLETSF